MLQEKNYRKFERPLLSPKSKRPFFLSPHTHLSTTSFRLLAANYPLDLVYATWYNLVCADSLGFIRQRKVAIHLVVVNKIHCGDCRDTLRQIPDQYVQTVITSPPYWGLRDYQLEPTVWGGDSECRHVWNTVTKPASSGGQGCSTLEGGKDTQEKMTATRNSHSSAFCQLCNAWRGSLGLEPDPDLYVSHLVEIFREVKRVLRENGIFWLNIADSYAGGGRGGNPADSPFRKQATNKGSLVAPTPVPPGLKPKDLCLIPDRLRLALQRDGWWVRCVGHWIKRNAMPSSQTDRPTVSHEDIILLSKSKTYYFDMDAIRVKYTKPLGRWGGDSKKLTDNLENGSPYNSAHRKREMRPNKKSRQFRTSDFWYMSVEELFSDEFMAFDVPTVPFAMEMCRSCKTVYTASEYRRRPTTVDDKGQKRRVCRCGTFDQWLSHFATFPPKLVEPMVLAGSRTGDILLDPFAGACTACLVAAKLGRDYIGIELNPDYVKLGEDRIARETAQLKLDFSYL